LSSFILTIFFVVFDAHLLGIGKLSYEPLYREDCAGLVRQASTCSAYSLYLLLKYTY
jgi:hypothetical protein